MSINKLTERIEKDASTEAEAIEKEAKKEAEAIAVEAKEQAKSIKEIAIKGAQREALYEQEALIAQANLKAKDMYLEVKRQTLDKAFELALKKLEKSSQEEYEKNVTKMLVSYSDGNEKIVMQGDEAEKIAKEANLLLAKKGREANLQGSDEKITGRGFILIDGKGARRDFLFESVIDFYKEEIEQEAFTILRDGAQDEH